jgi:hypothetical protein
MMMAFVTGCVALALFPRAASQSATSLRDRPWRAFAWGLGLVFLVPPLVVVAMFSVIALPIGLAVFALYLLALLLGYLCSALALGGALASRPSWRLRSQLAQFTVGLLILGLASLIPVASTLILFFAVTFGMGALALGLQSRWRRGRPEPKAAAEPPPHVPPVPV